MILSASVILSAQEPGLNLKHNLDQQPPKHSRHASVCASTAEPETQNEENSMSDKTDMTDEFDKIHDTSDQETEKKADAQGRQVAEMVADAPEQDATAIATAEAANAMAFKLSLAAKPPPPPKPTRPPRNPQPISSTATIATPCRKPSRRPIRSSSEMTQMTQCLRSNHARKTTPTNLQTTAQPPTRAPIADRALTLNHSVTGTLPANG